MHPTPPPIWSEKFTFKNIIFGHFEGCNPSPLSGPSGDPGQETAEHGMDGLQCKFQNLNAKVNQLWTTDGHRQSISPNFALQSRQKGSHERLHPPPLTNLDLQMDLHAYSPSFRLHLALHFNTEENRRCVCLNR